AEPPRAGLERSAHSVARMDYRYANPHQSSGTAHQIEWTASSFRPSSCGIDWSAYSNERRACKIQRLASENQRTTYRSDRPSSQSHRPAHRIHSRACESDTPSSEWDGSFHRLDAWLRRAGGTESGFGSATRPRDTM